MPSKKKVVRTTIEKALAANLKEDTFGVEALNFEANNLGDIGYLYGAGNGYGNCATYMSRTELEDLITKKDIK